ncbi:MAG: hypothetical protein ABI835_19045, partial [Chloroflexota bacterium]
MVEHIDGTVTHSTFPVEIAPYQPFRNIRTITHEVTRALKAEVHFFGDVFEMEDQRNWTDASYKTYSTPLDLPFPVEIAAGTQVQQSVNVRLIGDIPITLIERSAPIQLTVDLQQVVGHLPKLGLCSAEHDSLLTEYEIQTLRRLHLTHLRADVRFKVEGWEERLHQAMDEARQLKVALEMALHLADTPDAELAALRQIVDAQQPIITRWLIFQQRHPCTPPEAIESARRHLDNYDSSARFAGGTDAFFTQVNRERPAMASFDLLSYSLNPQVHAFDDASLVESLPAQAATLASARHFSEDRGLMVSPVTLKMRFNPAATDSNLALSEADPRQQTLFGAGWTMGSIKYLSEGGAESV